VLAEGEIGGCAVRLSVFEYDPGYPGYHPIAEVFVDGKPAPHCVTADEELGVAICHALDSGGELMFTNDGEDVLYMERHGQVIIIPKGRA
jgi:hypothetical protein